MGQIVYAMKTASGTFIANGINHHNCNRVLRGNLKKYREHLVKEIGENKVRELETRPPRKISTPELQKMLDEMKLKYKNLLEEKKKELYN